MCSSKLVMQDSLRRRVRSDKKAIKKALIRAVINASKSNCARKKVYYLGVEEGDAGENAYYRCGCGCTLLIYVARRVYYIVHTLF